MADDTTFSRRSFLTGLAGAGLLIAAPAIVRASSLMPVKSWLGQNELYLPADDKWRVFDGVCDWTAQQSVRFDAGGMVTFPRGKSAHFAIRAKRHIAREQMDGCMLVPIADRDCIDIDYISINHPLSAA